MKNNLSILMLLLSLVLIVSCEMEPIDETVTNEEEFEVVVVTCDLELEVVVLDSIMTAVVTGGTEPYSYLWSTGSTEDMAFVNGAGSYAVTVTDAEGCIIAASNEPEVGCENFSTEIFIGPAGQTIFTDVTGGTPPYQYTWSDGQTTESIENSGDSLYLVYVQDALGCFTADTILFNNGGDCIGLNVELLYDPSVDFLIANVTGGTEPYTYQWADGQGGSSVDVQTPGTYSVIVSDANGCGFFAEYIVPDTSGCNFFEVFIFQDSLVNILTAEVFGGTPPFTYSWSTSETTQQISVAENGEYTITAVDSEGCTATYTQFIAITTVCNFIGDIEFAHDQVNNSLSASPIGGIAPFLYTWSTGETTQSISVSSGNNYSVNVEDANGCVFAGEISI